MLCSKAFLVLGCRIEPKTVKPYSRELMAAAGGADVPGAEEPSWLQSTHGLYSADPLTEKDPRASPPSGFQGQLWAPQAALLQAMLDLENRPVLRIRPYYGEPDYSSLLRCQRARIAAEFSFGKTVLCIGLVCSSPRPRVLPSALTLPAMDLAPSKNHLTIGSDRRQRAFRSEGGGVFPTLSLTYERVIGATLVVAAPAVISQWENCIRSFAPHLKWFTVENVTTLREFHRQFTEAPDRINTYDLVLLKAGKVTTSFTVEGEPEPSTKQRSLTSALAKVTEGYLWARMIVDDFDTIRLAADDNFLPALFTWVISATCRSTNISKWIEPADTAAEFIRKNVRLPILGVACDDLFDNVLKLRCDDQFVKDHINTTTVTFRRITVEGGHAVGILHDLGIPDDIVEMAAAGAMETAAERLNIKVNSIGELVERVLAARVQKYRLAIRALERVGRARQIAAESELPKNEDMKEIRAALKKGTDDEADAALEKVGRPGRAFTQAMKSLEDWAEKEKEEHGGTLRRMRENVRENQCQACMVPIGDDDEDSAAYIVNCCQIIICGFCTVVGPEGGRQHYINRCPNCAADVNPKNDLIYVGENLELESALTDEALLEGGTDEALVESAAAAEPENLYARWDDNPRLRALVQLIGGAPVESISDKEVPPIVKGLLEGRRDSPVPPETPHRYLIFAMYSESSRQITAALKVLGVGFVSLHGKRREKDIAVQAFKSGEVNVMIATSSRDCAGLHLPEVTRLVLYHHHVDKHVAEQSVGRAQRVGRDFSLEVIELMSEGEVQRYDL